MALTHQQVRHVAELAKLELTDREVDLFRAQLSAILDYAARLDELDTEEVVCPDDVCEHTFTDAGTFIKGSSLKCEAYMHEESNYTARAYTEVQNSAPNVTRVVLEPREAVKGDIMKCSAFVEDFDTEDSVLATFRFEGIDIAVLFM